MPAKKKEVIEEASQFDEFRKMLELVEVVSEKFPDLKLKDDESADKYMERIRPKFLELLMMKAFGGDKPSLSVLHLIEKQRVENQLMVADILQNKKMGTLAARVTGGANGVQQLMNGTVRMN